MLVENTSPMMILGGVGVASAGATFALIYLYSRFKKPKEVDHEYHKLLGIRGKHSTVRKVQVDKKITNLQQSCGDPVLENQLESGEACSTGSNDGDEDNADDIAVASPGRTSDDVRSFTKEVKIAREIVAGLIGKSGVNIKGIQSQSNTSIAFKKPKSSDDDFVMCVIRGSRGNVTIADSLVQKFIMEHLVLYEEPLLVPSAAVGRIIGKGGETIRSIQEVSKARVMVDTRNKPGGARTRDARGAATEIKLKGTENQINVAKELIREKVEEAKTSFQIRKANQRKDPPSTNKNFRPYNKYVWRSSSITTTSTSASLSVIPEPADDTREERD